MRTAATKELSELGVDVKTVLGSPDKKAEPGGKKVASAAKKGKASGKKQAKKGKDGGQAADGV